MEDWQFVLYGVAAYLTLQLLTRLMDVRRHQRLQELAEEYRQQHLADAGAPTKPTPEQPDESGTDRQRAA